LTGEGAMKCQSCARPATVHLTDIVNGAKKELHLCQQCAEEQQLIKEQELNLPAILQTLLGQHVGPLPDELARLTCPACGTKFMEFRAEGRLGCPYDYTVFRSALEPLLTRIHRSEKHQGKRPAQPLTDSYHAELVDLRRQLHQAIQTEAYEQAAMLKKVIREKETMDEHG
jgi:protein arginine kinase activator